MREALLPDVDGLQDSRVAQLAEDFVPGEPCRHPVVVRLKAAHKVRQARAHLLQQIHQGESKRRGGRLERLRLAHQALRRHLQHARQSSG